MKTLFNLLFIFAVPLTSFAKPVVLLSYYDTFAKNKFNNSERVAMALAESLKNDSFEIKLCGLPTVFDKAYAAVENCQKNLATAPVMYLGLGEFGCNLKMETMGRNLDKNMKSADNDGNLRNQIIVHEGAKVIGFNFPAPDMYCAVSAKARGDINVSNSAGSFVCNNTAYQFAHYYPETPSGFIHVPSSICKGLEQKTVEAVENLKVMIRAGVKALEASQGEAKRLPLLRSEIESLRSNKGDQCKSEFFKRMKSADDMGFWSSFMGSN